MDVVEVFGYLEGGRGLYAGNGVCGLVVRVIIVRRFYFWSLGDRSLQSTSSRLFTTRVEEADVLSPSPTGARTSVELQCS